MSESQREIWEERIASASSPAEEQELIAQYLRALGIIPQVTF